LHHSEREELVAPGMLDHKQMYYFRGQKVKGRCR